MRLSRPCLAVFGALTIAAGSIVWSAPASAAATNYVALGDSYSSGTGAGNYDPDSGSCKRSANAYPNLWAAANATDSYRFAACSGATTSSVSSGQLGALSSSTTLVSITVGGNDAGFSNVMQTCVLQSTSTCQNRVAQAESYMRNTLPGRLDSLYAQIRSRAPSARVVVLGYPRLYTIVDWCVGLGNAKRTALNSAADTLAGVTRQAADRAGFTWSDVRDEFAGHELCSGDDWLNAVTLPIESSYHPTARGHRLGYLPAFNASAKTALKAESSARNAG
ncbi:SGNH/GDSL hydrolase family protein [Actinomadura livida]|uniref:Lysophospholipase L1-like esterase n=1 Tax=Actinomadura livida TaxID=79909 RepID=A0A7W7ICP3_9ACTN|nr:MULTISPECIES: SGNH/GDSL hydrolase family protein [Actinomadura]MBB4774479.1 lysophospholipase L1-like esterase [Actinomadura catellatispora]GGT82253.1 lipase 1 [Actinomadura livida]